MNVRKDFCATCLSQGRLMFPLPYLDLEDFVYFYNDLKLCRLDKICWECRHFVLKIACFKSKAREAQANLAAVLRKQQTTLQSLSRLKSSPGISLDITELDLQEQTPNIPINPVKQENDTEFTKEDRNELDDLKFDATETYNAADDHFEVFESVIWKPTLVKPPGILLKPYDNLLKPPETIGNVTGVFQHKVSSEIDELVVGGNGIGNATLMSLLNKNSNQLSNPPLLIEVPTLKLPILDPTLHGSEPKNHIPETSVENILETSQDTGLDVEDQIPSLRVKSAGNEEANVVQDVNGRANATLMSLLTRKSNLTNPPLRPTSGPTLHSLKQESHIPEISVEDIEGTSQEFITSQDQKPSYIEESLTEEERVKWWESKREMKFYKESIEVFRCEKCIEPFFTRRTFLGHQKLHTEAYGHISCDICELRFNNENALLKHRGTHYKLMRCTQCAHKWDTPNSMRRHCNIEHSIPVTEWNCDVCPREVTEYGRYLNHLRNHGTGECPRCAKKVSVNSLKTHMKTHKRAKTREEILEAKRQDSKLRYEKLKSDPNLYEQIKEKSKRNYLKRKERNPGKNYSEITEEMREKWRKNSNAYYRRRKMNQVVHVNLNDDVKPVLGIRDEEIDPLSS